MSKSANLSSISHRSHYKLLQLDDTERSFDRFWLKHEVRLRQCLHLRQFEEDFRKVFSLLSSLVNAYISSCKLPLLVT